MSEMRKKILELAVRVETGGYWENMRADVSSLLREIAALPEPKDGRELDDEALAKALFGAKHLNLSAFDSGAIASFVCRTINSLRIPTDAGEELLQTIVAKSIVRYCDGCHKRKEFLYCGDVSKIPNDALQCASCGRGSYIWSLETLNKIIYPPPPSTVRLHPSTPLTAEMEKQVIKICENKFTDGMAFAIREMVKDVEKNKYERDQAIAERDKLREWVKEAREILLDSGAGALCICQSCSKITRDFLAKTAE